MIFVFGIVFSFNIKKVYNSNQQCKYVSVLEYVDHHVVKQGKDKGSNLEQDED